MKRLKDSLWGLALIITAVIIALNNFNLININIDGIWTLIIIVPSFIGILCSTNKMLSFIFFIIGCALFMGYQGFIEFDVIKKLVVPIILLIIGLNFIFKKSINKEINSINKSENEEYYSIFSGKEIKVDGKKFKGADIMAIFGGVEYDLRNSIISESKVINCLVIFGGVDIFVPEGVNVKVKSNSIFGGVSNKSRSTYEDEKIIYVNATCLFGGIDIK